MGRDDNEAVPDTEVDLGELALQVALATSTGSRTRESASPEVSDVLCPLVDKMLIWNGDNECYLVVHLFGDVSRGQ